MNDGYDANKSAARFTVVVGVATLVALILVVVASKFVVP